MNHSLEQHEGIGQAQHDPATLPCIFICGRQHSGNTMVSLITGRMPGCFTIDDEGIFFEHRGRLDKLPLTQRAMWIAQNMRVGPELTASLVDHLPTWAKKRPQTDALALYREAMRFLCERYGKTFWAQKATSYIFYAREILRDMPEARIVYVLRNPFDIVASQKRRTPDEEYLFGTIVSWNRGLREILRLRDTFPQRVHITCYEKVVGDSEATVAAMCRFLDVPFSIDLFDIPHVNPAEDPFKVQQNTKGLTTARVLYYPQRLAGADMKAIDLLVDWSRLRMFYPKLPHVDRRYSLTDWLGAMWLIGSGPFRYVIGRIRFARKFGSPFFRRTLRRLVGWR